MKSSVQARLDQESQRALVLLVRRLGWSPSKVVRESLRLFAVCHGDGSGSKIIGVGKFVSGIRDLGSNKRHLSGFGK